MKKDGLIMSSDRRWQSIVRCDRESRRDFRDLAAKTSRSLSDKPLLSDGRTVERPDLDQESLERIARSICPNVKRGDMPEIIRRRVDVVFDW